MEIAICALTVAILVNVTITILLIDRMERQNDELNELIDEMIEYMGE